jgi:hypothetical protein
MQPGLVRVGASPSGRRLGRNLRHHTVAPRPIAADTDDRSAAARTHEGDKQQCDRDKRHSEKPRYSPMAIAMPSRIVSAIFSLLYGR